MSRTWMIPFIAIPLVACNPKPGLERPAAAPIPTVSEISDPTPHPSPEPTHLELAAEGELAAAGPEEDPARERPGAPEPAAPGSFATYTLRRGESMAHFARWARLPVEAIADTSDLPLDQPLAVGTEIRLPADHVLRAQIETARDAHHRRRAEGYLDSRGGMIATDFYVVRTGDTAWSIARAHGALPVWLLETLNPSLDLEALRPGQSLMLPVVADSIDQEIAMEFGL